LQQRDEKWSGLNQTIIYIIENDAFVEENAALKQKNLDLLSLAHENEINKFKTTEFMRKNEALEKEVTALKERLEMQRDEMKN
jgi:hypothetical protein